MPLIDLVERLFIIRQTDRNIKKLRTQAYRNDVLF